MNEYKTEQLAQDEKFVEKGADLEHDRWARWQEYMFSKSFFTEIASQVESIDLDGSPDGLPESRDFNLGVKTGWNSLRDKLAGCVIIPKEYADRWFRQVATKYKDLSEEEKESDRKETRSYLPLLILRDQALLEAFKKDVEEMVENKLPDILHEFQREFNAKDIPFILEPLERRAVKNKYVEIVLSLLKDYNLNKEI